MSTAPEAPAEENYDLDGPQKASNPWAERTLGREAFYVGGKNGDKSEALKRDGEARCFVIRRPQRANLYGGVEFWIQIGLRADLSVIAAPFYSAARLNEGWTYEGKSGKNAGKPVLGIQYPPVDKCALAKLVQVHPDLIAPLKFQGVIQYWPAKGDQPAQAKRDYKKLFALEMYEVLFEYQDVPDPAKPGMTKRVAVIDPSTHKPKYTINPRPYIWKMNDPWWEQLRAKVLAPKFAAAAAAIVGDIDGESKAKAKKELPTTDISKVVLKLWAKTDEEKPDRATYEVDFSAGLTIDSSAIVPVDELPSKADGTIDWDQIFPPMTQAQADKVVADAKRAYDELMGDEHRDAPPAGGAPKSQDAPPPPGDDDIPF
jgi:hypothetical protein